MNMRILAAALVLTFLAPAVLSGEEIKVLEARGEALLGEDRTPAEAKAIALNNARRNALEEAVGVVVHGSSVIYNSELINELVVAATKGLIVREKVLENKCQTRDEQIYCEARIEAHVKPLNLEKKATLRISRASVKRPDKETEIKSPVFQNNDEMQVRVTPSEDTYLSIFSVDQYGNIIKLFPNEYFKKNTAAGDKEFVFPDDVQRAMGLKLRVHTPKGLKKAVESVLVIATREKTDLLSGKSAGNQTISDLMKELADIDAVWTEKTLGYEVRE